MANLLSISFPGKLVFGNGCLSRLADEVIQLKPTKVFIASIAALSGAMEGFVEALQRNKIQIIIDTTIVNEPSNIHGRRTPVHFIAIQLYR